MRKHYFPRISGVVFVISLLLISGYIFGMENWSGKTRVDFGNCNISIDYDSSYYSKVVDTSVEDTKGEGEVTLYKNSNEKLFDEESVVIDCFQALYEAKSFSKITRMIPIFSNYINQNWQISLDDQSAGIVYLLNPKTGLYYTITFGPDSSTTLQDSNRFKIDYLSKRNSKTTPIPKLRDTIE